MRKRHHNKYYFISNHQTPKYMRERESMIFINYAYKNYHYHVLFTEQ